LPPRCTLFPTRRSSDLDAKPEHEQCIILVEDDGQGIPAVERERIFARGTRLDTGKPGTGLGLAIVRDVVEIYGGSVTLDESEDLDRKSTRLNSSHVKIS